jgi:hypothetical protein
VLVGASALLAVGLVGDAQAANNATAASAGATRVKRLSERLGFMGPPFEVDGL